MSYDHLTVTVDSVDSIFYYQIDCIQKHPEIPILPIHVAVSGHQVRLENEVFDRVRMSDYLDAHPLNRKEWIWFLICLGELLQTSMDYFLDADCFDLSLSMMFYPSDKDEPFNPENILYRYIPAVRDLTIDPLHAFLSEISLILSSSPVSEEKSSGCAPCELSETIFSQEELDCIAGWSLETLKGGLNDVREMQNSQIATLPEPKRRLFGFHFLQRSKSTPTPKISKSKASAPFGSYGLFLVFGAEMGLILLAFQILYHQTGFRQRFTPVLLVSGILLCFGFIDLFLLLSKKSPLRLHRRKGEEDEEERVGATGDERNPEDSIFNSKEEKTLHLVLSEEPRRIAMISSGIPGTQEESSGLKAYILVDDFLIGRDGTKVDFKINSLSIGRIHARIIRRENAFFMEDLESKNGTFVDQRRLRKHEEILLPEKCKIRFAEREFYFVAN